MDIEAILAITFIFGGGTLFLLSVSPVGRALADRIRGKAVSGDEQLADLQDSIYELIEDNRNLHEELTDVHERLEFAERLLVERNPRDESSSGNG